MRKISAVVGLPVEFLVELAEADQLPHLRAGNRIFADPIAVRKRLDKIAQDKGHGQGHADPKPRR